MFESYANLGRQRKHEEPDDAQPLAQDGCNDSWMPEPALKILAANLNAIIKELDARPGAKKTSWVDLAKRLGVPARSLGHWLKAENSPMLPQIDALAKGLRRQPWELLMPGMTLPPPELSEKAWTIARQFDEIAAGADQDRAYAVIRAVLQGYLPPVGSADVAAEPEPDAPPLEPTTKRAKAR